MEAIVQALQAPGAPARVAAVISNRPLAQGLHFAQTRGLPTAVVDHQTFPDREHFDRALIGQIDAFAPDLVVLAGFMRILTPVFTEHYEGRLMNIHPSLLPSFPGLHTHARAIEAGCRFAGATVHYVTAELDHGPIVAQAVVTVRADETPDSLAARVLKLEHQMYPACIRAWALGDLEIKSGRVQHRQGQVMAWLES